MLKNEWIRCPVCGSKTRDRLREDTVLKNYPLYCPKCKQDTLINAKELYITVIKEPDAQPMKLRVTTIICSVFSMKPRLNLDGVKILGYNIDTVKIGDCIWKRSLIIIKI